MPPLPRRPSYNVGPGSHIGLRQQSCHKLGLPYHDGFDITMNLEGGFSPYLQKLVLNICLIRFFSIWTFRSSDGLSERLCAEGRLPLCFTFTSSLSSQSSSPLFARSQPVALCVNPLCEPDAIIMESRSSRDPLPRCLASSPRRRW